MGSKESKAQVIDTNDEYKNEVLTNYGHDSPSTSTLSWNRSSEDETVMQGLAGVTTTGEKVFSLIANVLKTFGDETNKTLMICFQALTAGTYFCQGAGIVLNLIQGYVVAVQLNRIYKEIQEVRNDIKELERTMKWETTRIQYADICTMIVTGMKICNQIRSNAGNDSVKHDYEERLKELCSNQRFMLAMNILLDGITGKGDFRIDLMQLIYEQADGSRPDVMRMAGRLLQLLTGGITTLLTYETLMRGQQSAKQFEAAMYADRMKEVEQCYKEVIQRCLDESKERMARDVDEICKGKQELEDVPEKVCDTLSSKYDWLQFQCIAFKNDYVKCHGSRIEKDMDLDEFLGKGKLVCFYTSKSAPLKKFSSSERDHVDEIISKRHRGKLADLIPPEFYTKPDAYDAVLDYMKQTSDQRQCWVVGIGRETTLLTQLVFEDRTRYEIYHGVSNGTYYHHLIKECEPTDTYCFVSMFFQDRDASSSLFHSSRNLVDMAIRAVIRGNNSAAVGSVVISSGVARGLVCPVEQD